MLTLYFNRCKDEQNAQNELKKHAQLEGEVEDHASRIGELGEVCRQLVGEARAQVGEDGAESLVLLSGCPAEALTKRQMQIDKLYAGLKDLAQERRLRLEETVKLFMLHRDIDDLEQWIADKVAYFFIVYFHCSFIPYSFLFSFSLSDLLII